MRIRTAGTVVATVLVIASAAAAQSARKCLTGMNLAGIKVAAAAQSEAARCVKLRGAHQLPEGLSAQACLTADLRSRITRASVLAALLDSKRCSAAPPFGYAGAAAVAGAGRTLALDLVADLFGPDLDAAIEVQLPCQTRLLHNVARLTATQAREFLACAKTGLARGTIGDAAGLASCLTALDADPRGRIAKVRQRLVSDDARHCSTYTDRHRFPGHCEFAADFLDCVDTRTRCRLCEALAATHALTVDCEQFDDGLANGSCGPCVPDPEGRCCTLAERDACGFCGGTGFRCGWAEISVGTQHACGRKLDGTLACWGSNFAGELDAPAGAFVQVTSGGSSSEAPDRGHSCAVRADGTVACWGRNDLGQASPPAGVFTHVAAGSHHTCGLRDDGTIACWGMDSAGESTPPAGQFVRLSAFRRGTCAVRSDGEIVCWGTDFGSGSLTPLPGPFSDVETGSHATYGVRPDQSVVRWGEPLPQFEPPAGSYVEIDAGNVNGCARRPDGSIVCWPDDVPAIAPVPPAGTFVQLDASERIFCAVRDDATLFCWGDTFTGSGAPPL